MADASSGRKRRVRDSAGGLLTFWCTFFAANLAWTKAMPTRIRFRLKTHLFLYGLAFHPHVSGENSHRKRPTPWKFLKRRFRVLVKTDLFEKSDVTRSTSTDIVFGRLRFRFQKRYVWTDKFFTTKKKMFVLSNENRYLWTGLNKTT